MEFLVDKEMTDIEKSLRSYDTLRDEVINISREIIKQSKVVINHAHRGEDDQESIITLKQLKKKMDDTTTNSSGLTREGSVKVAYQEFTEAMLFTEFMESGIFSKEKLGVDEESYLLGLCDLTGELARMAVRKATTKDYGEVRRISSCIEEIHSFFMRLDLRNSELRKKSDQVKWNLKKVEEILYDISMRG